MLHRSPTHFGPMDRGGASSHSIHRSFSMCEWRPFDLVQKKSGLHNLSRAGYDEEKCRSVLVRFCGHVPRNYQYKDGIQQVFLVLREHLGDENLDLAGGVLYELIEVDCEHTDDPGAAFQRWRYDHMCRYADLELPHIPHMTTIASSIIPTDRLARWRREHSERYRFVLSDSSPAEQRLSGDPSCIRNKKAWLIEHTLFVSSRSDGTRPMRSPNPKEFHEIQWNSHYGGHGKLVEERQYPLSPLNRPDEESLPRTADATQNPLTRSERLRQSLSSLSIVEKAIDRKGKQKKNHDLEQKRLSWMAGPFAFEAGSLFKDRRTNRNTVTVPFPKDCQIPNAIFARKFLLIDQGENLPSDLPISQMPTAESKATDTIVEAVTAGLLNQPSPWLFRGPFTPQLGFDGGLDYQWGSSESGVIFRRFDREADVSQASRLGQNSSLHGDSHSQPLHALAGSASPSKRRGQLFDYGSDTEAEYHLSMCPTSCDSLTSVPLQHPQSYPWSEEIKYEPFNIPSGTLQQPISKRHEPDYRDVPLFDNIEFTIQTDQSECCRLESNRKTAVIERPWRASSDSAWLPKMGSSLATCSVNRQWYGQERNQGDLSHSKQQNDTTDTPREIILSNLQQDSTGLQIPVSRSRIVSHGITGELLQPLRYNASGGGKSITT
ncbi:hypothetical protein F5Y16DRAFT_329313 [Xylariaceae sp. FL0255]|nr:hypothetical protein F5Y16DRAFT_329313 [Xylariaceae sp. FL0255]